VGLDDVLHPWFADQQAQHARRVLASRSAAACRATCRAGLPPGERPAVWACALGLPPLDAAAAADAAGPVPPRDGAGVLPWAGPYEPSRGDVDALRALCGGAARQPMLVDALACADVAELAGASEHYFPFADTLRCAARGPGASHRS
jgi:hypothetical protein